MMILRRSWLFIFACGLCAGCLKNNSTPPIYKPSDTEAVKMPDPNVKNKRAPLYNEKYINRAKSNAYTGNIDTNDFDQSEEIIDKVYEQGEVEMPESRHVRQYHREAQLEHERREMQERKERIERKSHPKLKNLIESAEHEKKQQQAREEALKQQINEIKSMLQETRAQLSKIHKNGDRASKAPEDETNGDGGVRQVGQEDAQQQDTNQPTTGRVPKVCRPKL